MPLEFGLLIANGLFCPQEFSINKEWNRPFTRPHSPVWQKWSGNRSSN